MGKASGPSVLSQAGSKLTRSPALAPVPVGTMDGRASGWGVPSLSITSGGAKRIFLAPAGTSPPGRSGSGARLLPATLKAKVLRSGMRLMTMSSLTLSFPTWYRRSTPGQASG